MIDITALKDSYERQNELSGRMIAFQEEERKRLGRELHDDITQRLSLMAIDLDLLAKCTQGIRKIYKSELARMTENVRTMVSDVQALSHGLHPSKLEQLGLVPTLKSLCRDVARQCEIRIGFSSSASLPELPSPSQLCLSIGWRRNACAMS